MSVDAAALTEIGSLLAGTNQVAAAVSDLRRRFPALSVTSCDPSDVDMEMPVLTSGVFSLYLVDGRDHCWRLTTETAHATGLVVVAS
jgi:hypothetical protein